jgi:hypothetical protein
MSVCLDYQSVYYRRDTIKVSNRYQILAASFLLLVLAFKVWVRIECTNLGYVIAKEKQTTLALDMQRRELDLQLSVLKRTDNLSKKAKTVLGLVALDPRQARKINY